jgi:hypothetical protein
MYPLVRVLRTIRGESISRHFFVTRQRVFVDRDIASEKAVCSRKQIAETIEVMDAAL